MMKSPCNGCIVYVMCDSLCEEALASLTDDHFIREIVRKQVARHNKEQEQLYEIISKELADSIDKDIIKAVIDSYSANQKEDKDD